MKRLDVVGKVFNRLTVVRDVPSSKPRKVIARCECGNILEVLLCNVVSKHTKSCGCLRRGVPKKHGLAKSTEYKTWQCIKDRCYNTTNRHYPSYGGRGITMFEGWREDFSAFYKYVGVKPTSGGRWSLGRVDNNGNYEPGNVRWEDTFTQARNRSKLSSNTSGHSGVTAREHNGRVRWVARWYDLTGQSCSKSFSEKVHGVAAKTMAVEYRAQMIELLNQQGAGYSDQHGEEFPRWEGDKIIVENVLDKLGTSYEQ